MTQCEPVEAQSSLIEDRGCAATRNGNATISTIVRIFMFLRSRKKESPHIFQ